MAMIRCPECGRQISDKAPACPNCGVTQEYISRYLSDQDNNKNKEKRIIPLQSSKRKDIKCAFCHQQTRMDGNGKCLVCGYPVYTLTSNGKSVSEEVRQYREAKGVPVSSFDEAVTKAKTDQTEEKQQSDLERPAVIHQVKEQPDTSEHKNEEKSGRKKVPFAVLGGVAALVILTGAFINITGEKKTEEAGENTAAVSVSSAEDQTIQAEEEVKTDSQEVEAESLSEREEQETEEAVAYNPEEDVAGEDTKGSEYKIGDIVHFGRYEQDNDTSNGAEEIEWIVLDQKDDNYLLLSRYGLECKTFNEDPVDITWETCTLREWLNDDFYNNAFNSNDRKKIQLTNVIAEKSPYSSTDPGNNTNDKIFILNVQELKEYVSENEKKQAVPPTKYAESNGAYIDSNSCCWWWLRSPGSESKYAMLVDGTGGLHLNVIYENVCVRPVLWVNL